MSIYEGQQLRNFIDNQRISKSTIAKELGMTRVNLYQLFDSKRLEYETKKKFEDYFDTKIFEVPNPMSFLEQRRGIKMNYDELYLVPFVDIPAQAGYSKAYQQRDYIATLKKYPILPDVDPTGAIWRYFQIEGDSMEPEIMEGDVILCSQVHKEDWQSIQNYYTHVIVTEEELWIKDVFKDSETEWILLSQNESVKPFTVKLEDIRQVWVMRRHIKARAKKARMYDIKEIKKQLKK